MGDMTRILLTGATGFVGGACLAAARARGIEVVAVYRGEAPPAWADDPGIVPLRADLSDPFSAMPLRIALEQAQAVIHAAAHLGGEARAHETDTLEATKTVLGAMSGSAARLVLVSSLTVYDTMRILRGGTLTEDSPVETPDTARDAYCRAKLRQEDLCRASGLPLWILRPGAIYGPGRTWHALNGVWASRLHVTITSGGELPLTHVDHVAQALVSAALTDPRGTRVLNVIDDDRPTRSRFVRAHRRVSGWPRLSVPVPYLAWLSVVKALSPLRDRLPGLLQKPILRARMMPLHYPNTALRTALGGADLAPFEEMLAASLETSP